MTQVDLPAAGDTVGTSAAGLVVGVSVVVVGASVASFVEAEGTAGVVELAVADTEQSAGFAHTVRSEWVVETAVEQPVVNFVR